MSRIPTTNSNETKHQERISVSHVVEKLISGLEADYDREQLARVFPYDSFYLLSVVFSGNIPRGDHTKVQDLITRQYHSYIAQAAYHTITTDKNETALILNVNKDKSQEVIDFAKRAAETCTDSNFVLSEPFFDLSQMGHIYNERLSKLIQYSFY